MKTGPNRAPYTVASPETWALIRAAYLQGASAGALSRHFGVPVDSIYQRASRETWTKRAWAARLTPPPFPGMGPVATEDEAARDDPPPEAPPADPASLAEAALRAAARALAAGRAADVHAYLRAAELAGRMARESAQAAEAVEADKQAERRRTEELAAELQNRFDRIRASIEAQKAREKAGFR